MTDGCDRRQRVRKAWDAIAGDYTAARRHDGPDADLLTELAGELEPGARVLDIGCGDGRRTIATLLAALPSLAVVGLDLSRVQLGLAREQVSGAALVQGEMTALPFSNHSFDALSAYHSVFHVPREE